MGTEKLLQQPDTKSKQLEYPPFPFKGSCLDPLAPDSNLPVWKQCLRSQVTLQMMLCFPSVKNLLPLHFLPAQLETTQKAVKQMLPKSPIGLQRWGETGINSFHVCHHHHTLCWEGNFSLELISHILKLSFPHFPWWIWGRLAIKALDGCTAFHWAYSYLADVCTTDVMNIASFPFRYLGLCGQFNTPSNFQKLSSELQSPENKDQALGLSEEACHAALYSWEPCCASWLLCLLSKGKTFSEGPWRCWGLPSGWAGGITAAKARAPATAAKGGRSTSCPSASAGSRLGDGVGRRGQDLGSILAIGFICWSL